MGKKLRNSSQPGLFCVTGVEWGVWAIRESLEQLLQVTLTATIIYSRLTHLFPCDEAEG